MPSSSISRGTVALGALFFSLTTSSNACQVDHADGVFDG
jgi:hypothetical protein